MCDLISGFECFDYFAGSVAISGSPFQKSFVSGAIDPRKSVVVRHTATLVCTQNLPHNIFVQPRDAYNNPCTFQANDHPAEVFFRSKHKYFYSKSMKCKFHFTFRAIVFKYLHSDVRLTKTFRRLPRITMIR